ncbi:hypothetical protein SOASR030_15400 [Leminorella grimontii]|uniref:Uncharacterized protein n=1 Tax=Leminorella grimontii TaxID=82981 RepID=A0AAV5N1N5_9GAMM|nr:hypothetical protein SOASR030_15400 [Leminorella grimontii]
MCVLYVCRNLSAAYLTDSSFNNEIQIDSYLLGELFARESPRPQGRGDGEMRAVVKLSALQAGLY